MKSSTILAFDWMAGHKEYVSISSPISRSLSRGAGGRGEGRGGRGERGEEEGEGERRGRGERGGDGGEGKGKGVKGGMANCDTLTCNLFHRNFQLSTNLWETVSKLHPLQRTVPFP